MFETVNRLTLATVVCASLPVAAQEPVEAPALEEITVYATRNALPVFDYPGQVSIRGREEIDLFLPSTVSDLLRDVPGVEFSGGPRRTGETPSIRGRGGENVLVLIDGARQTFISAHDGRFFIEPELIGTAEVLRGPASSLYGTGAVGGVLAFETVDASDLLKADQGAGVRLRAGYQDVNEETSAAVTGFYARDEVDLLGSLSLRNSGDIDLGSGDRLPSDDDIVSGLFKGEYQLSESLALNGSWLRFDNQAEEPNNGQGVNVAGAGAESLVHKDIRSDTLRLGVDLDPLDNRWIDASLTLYRTETDVTEDELDTDRAIVRNIQTHGISLRNAAVFGTGRSTHTLTVGGDWFEDQQVGRDSATGDASRGGVPDGSSAFVGAFLQLESIIDRPFGMPGNLLLVPGVRYDDFDNEAGNVDAADNSADEVSTRFGVSYGPVDWLRLYGNYAQGFRAPSVNELYLDGTHFSLPHPVLGPGVFITNEFQPNPGLVPEDSETLELGVGFDFNGVWQTGDRLSLKASHWRSDVDDLIDLTVDFAFDPTCFAPPFFAPCSAGTSSSRNVAEAELDGIEVEATYDSTRFFSRLTYGEISGENRSTGSDLGVLMPDRLNLDLRLKWPEQRLALGTRIQLADDFERREIDAGSATSTLVEARDGYAVYDLYASWRPRTLASVRIDLTIENVLDEDYERVFAGVAEPGRNLKLGLTWQGGN